jgi:catechol 2,3-dioxygenase-like lactoylglutathione lyase family enzyme
MFSSPAKEDSMLSRIVVVIAAIVASMPPAFAQGQPAEQQQPPAVARRVTGIGGIFFKAKSPEALAKWYRDHLGMNVEKWGGVTFRWAQDNPTGAGTTAWRPFPENTSYFAPSAASFMINYRVENLRSLLAALRAEGCTVDDKVEESAFGKFGWVTDPEGNRVELWEPPAGK